MRVKSVWISLNNKSKKRIGTSATNDYELRFLTWDFSALGCILHKIVMGMTSNFLEDHYLLLYCCLSSFFGTISGWKELKKKKKKEDKRMHLLRSS